jgi:ribosomal protein S18 acetylase RimI-like enzyme
MSAMPAAHAVAALESNLNAFWSRFGRAAGSRLHDDGRALWYESPIAAVPYNGVLRCDAGTDDRLIDRICARFRERKVPFVWFVPPSLASDRMDAALRARGLVEGEAATGMWADLAALPAAPPPPAGIEIRAVETEADLRAMLELVRWRWNVAPRDALRLQRIAEAFDFTAPGGTRCWIAWQGGVPVAKATLNVAGGAAGLYGVATRPEARGRGLARTLTLHVFEAARAQGLRLGVLHATAMARGLYPRLGFRVAAPFRVYADASSGGLH